MRCMAGSRCRVSFTDSDGVLHGVDVDAESLYEAVAIAVAQFREDDINPLSPGPMTEFTVAVYRNPVEHKIRLGQVANGPNRARPKGRRGLRSGRGCGFCWATPDLPARPTYSKFAC